MAFRQGLWAAVCAAGLLAGLACAARSGPGAAAASANGRRVLPVGATAPLFNDLGPHRRAVTTSSDLAQRYFNQGLVLTYGFNHAEAARSFREAQRLDPSCAMCFWGEAYALGPNINKPMDPADNTRAWVVVQGALRTAAAHATPVEKALIEALAQRYTEKAPADRSDLDRAYADAMRRVARAYPDDADVQALFAEALMDTMPWDYYTAQGEPKPETQEAIAALERALEIDPHHPGAIHYYIHAVEASHTPERAEAPADRLRNLVPGAGHLVHMPSHIYLRVGRYHDASEANVRAAGADETYINQCRAQGFYPAAYYPHNIDFLQSSAGFEGRSAVAIDAARKLRGSLAEGAVEQFPTAEEYLPRYLYTLARFGRWEEILAEPRPDPKLRYLTGAWHYVRGLALAATGRVDAAQAELERVRALRDEPGASELYFLSGATPAQLLDIAAAVLEGRIAGARGDWASALAPLERAVALQDALPYTEPPSWYFPNREALGHALLQAGRPADAEAVFRTQLEKTPRNGWSLFGLAQSLRAQGKTEEAALVEDRFREAWKLADVSLPASIF
jgi:tetratricopeptide (TPR) repeat protein